MTDEEHDIPITDEIPENELEAGPRHFALIAEDGTIEVEEDGHADA